jgi:hypothetical protein
VSRVLAWLRAGYPDGVPQQDYVALLGILKRQLSDEEIVMIASTLTGGAYEDREDRIRHAIEQRTLQHASDEEISRVSARLAIAGWPLGVVDSGETPDEADPEPADAATVEPEAVVPADEPTGPVAERTVAEGRPADPESRRNVMVRLVAWVRQGYPTGVPAADYVPLVALLSRRLTKDEVIDIVIELRGSGVLPNETGRIGAAIMGTTNEMPSIEEIERVRHHMSEVTGTDFSQD